MSVAIIVFIASMIFVFSIFAWGLYSWESAGRSKGRARKGASESGHTNSSELEKQAGKRGNLTGLLKKLSRCL